MSKKKEPSKKVLREIQGRERQKLKEVRVPIFNTSQTKDGMNRRNSNPNELIQQNKDSSKRYKSGFANMNGNQGNVSSVVKENVEEITVKDFVVRSNIFHCMHEEHKVESIQAVVSVITKFGNYKQISFTGGYCPNCNLYFIMEPDYKRLKETGTIVCRVTSYKAYQRMGVYGGDDMKLADESLLMQYGYNVSQVDDLTATQRRRILSLLLENKIMTKAEIVSYLNFFIKQRTGQKKYLGAIERWNSDIEYLRGVNGKTKEKVMVGSIKVNERIK